MIKFMLFIDGTWLYSNTPRLVEKSSEPNFVLDFGKLPRVLAAEVASQMGQPEYTVVRTHLFGSYADHVDPRDTEPVQRRLNFFAMLRQQHHYEVEAFPVEFRGKRLRKTDREPGDSFEPKEKCVDIALATSMLFSAAMPNAYDVAIAVLGDQDFKPVLQSVRRLGKRVAIASIAGACAGDYSDPTDAARVRDLDLIWLEDLLPELARRYEEHVLECQSPFHRGERPVRTTYYPKRNEKFYCPACREEFARQKAEGGVVGAAAAVGAGSASAGGGPANEATNWAPMDTALSGVLKHKRVDKAYGFIRVEGCGDWDDAEYFFHESDLVDGTRFAELAEGTVVDFEVKAEPPPGEGPAGPKRPPPGGRVNGLIEVREAVEVLSRTPALLDTWLVGLSEPWLAADEGEGTYDPVDVVAHLVHGEETDWIPRIERMLEHGEALPFEPFDREGFRAKYADRSLEWLVPHFSMLRRESLEKLVELGLRPVDLNRTGMHPELGRVTLRQLLAAWVAHDLTHVAQIARVMAKRYADTVGPWRAYLGVLNDRVGSR